MGRDVALLERAEQGVSGARIYFWDSMWVTLGRNQNPKDALLDLRINQVQRPTGGAAVLHGHDLTIGIAMPLDALDCKGREVKKAYLGLVHPIIEALKAVGIPAALGIDIPNRPNQDSPYCFAMKANYDVLNQETGEKICGCAMHMTQKAALLQASIPVSVPLAEPSKIMRNYVATPLVALDRDAFINAFRNSLP